MFPARPHNGNKNTISKGTENSSEYAPAEIHPKNLYLSNQYLINYFQQ